MPSGPKKRKAVRKKKTKTNEAQLHGDDDDLVVHDGKDSDGGDVSSPLSQHADDDLHVAAVGDDKEEEEVANKGEEEVDPQSVRLNAAVEKEPVLVENGESTVKVTAELEIADEKSESENKSPTNQDPEIHENPSGGYDDDNGNSSDSSSSSDDESQPIEKKRNVVLADSNQDHPALELSNSVLPDEQKDDQDLDLSFKPEDDLPAEITQVSVSDAANTIHLEATPLTNYESVDIAKDEIVAVLNNNEVDKNVSPTVLETTRVIDPVLSSSTEVSIDVTNNANDQPRVVAQPLKPTQRTSLASCCGLFELFTGPNR